MLRYFIFKNTDNFKNICAALEDNTFKANFIFFILLIWSFVQILAKKEPGSVILF